MISRRITCLVLALSAIPVLLLAQLDVSRFTDVKRLTPPAYSSNAPIGRFVLDDETYEASDESYGNIRITADDNAEIRFMVRRCVTTTALTNEYTIPSRTTALKEPTAGTLLIDIERVGDATSREFSFVDIETPSADFEKAASVSVSDNGSRWQLLVENCPIFDYSRVIDLRNTRIVIPPSRQSHIRLQLTDIADAGLSPLRTIIGAATRNRAAGTFETYVIHDRSIRVSGITLRGQSVTLTPRNPVICDYATGPLQTEFDKTNRCTVLTFSSKYQPLTSLSINPGDPNFARDVTVARLKRGTTNWTAIASSRIHRIRLGAVTNESISISFGAQVRAAAYRVEIADQDNPPLRDITVQARGEANEIVFMSPDSGECRLLLGRDKLRPPSYDIASLVAWSDAASAPLWYVSAMEPNPAFTPDKSERKPAGKTVLMVALVLMTLVLVWIVARAAKSLGDES